MNRFKNILVVAGSGTRLETNPAVIQGFNLAAQNNAEITLMDVISTNAGIRAEYKDFFSSEEITDILKKEREKSLRQFGETLTKPEKLHVKVNIGRDFIEIVRQVILEKHDLLIKVANQHPDHFDSSDFHLMRKCPVPVWLLKPKNHNKPKKILAAIDLALETHEEGQALNTNIMDLATSISNIESSELHVISCWSLYGEYSMRNNSFIKISDDKIAQLLQEEAAANRFLLDKLITRYETITTNTHLVKGDPVDHIPCFVRNNNIDIVVMGTVARSGIPGLLIGNTAETILQMIDSSVITLKPSGFKSPIE